MVNNWNVGHLVFAKWPTSAIVRRMTVSYLLARYFQKKLFLSPHTFGKLNISSSDIVMGS